MAQLHDDADVPLTHTHPSFFPASVVIVHTPLALPLQGVEQEPLLAVPDAQAGGDVAE